MDRGESRHPCGNPLHLHGSCKEAGQQPERATCSALDGHDASPRETEDGEPYALAQLDQSGYAFATIGTPVASQEITTFVRVDSFGGSVQGAWVGLLARYVDADNYYYVAIRNSNQILIRKRVNGVITTLASASFTAAPGTTYYLRFRVIDDVLQVFNGATLVASAHDSEIRSG